jgi:hypothetical protein
VVNQYTVISIKYISYKTMNVNMKADMMMEREDQR